MGTTFDLHRCVMQDRFGNRKCVGKVGKYAKVVDNDENAW